jgi:hydroxymethylpyrimidine/phosphomethylpyrimidine kinase
MTEQQSVPDSELPTSPVVLALSGHDPTGGAGIQADIEAITAQGCHAASAVTCLTVQDTRNLRRIEPVSADLLLAQINAVLSDLSVDVIKIGLIGNATNAAVIAGLLADWPRIPVVFDPVLRAGGGAELSNDHLLEVLREQLLPRTWLLTPNWSEARRLTGRADPVVAARLLVEAVGEGVLLTGADEGKGKLVENRLFAKDGSLQTFDWPRFEGRFHGSGCTLAAACAARLALGEALPIAVKRAQSYTWQTLGSAQALGHGQRLPRRFRP